MNDWRKTKSSAVENKKTVRLTEYSEKPDLNSASKNDLMKVSGIGEKTADSVVQYRKKHGRINDFDQLEEIPMIGPRRKEILKQNFTITEFRSFCPGTSDKISNSKFVNGSSKLRYDSSVTASKKLIECSEKTDLNSASKSDLMKVSGIGEKTAESVVQYRKKHGRINDFEQLEEIPMIGPQRKEILKQNFTISESAIFSPDASYKIQYPKFTGASSSFLHDSKQKILVNPNKNFSALAGKSSSSQNIAGLVKTEPHYVHATDKEANIQNHVHTSKHQTYPDITSTKPTTSSNSSLNESVKSWKEYNYLNRNYLTSEFLPTNIGSPTSSIKTEVNPNYSHIISSSYLKTTPFQSSSYTKDDHSIQKNLSKVKLNSLESCSTLEIKSHYDYHLPQEMNAIVPLNHKSSYVTKESFQATSSPGMVFFHANIRSLKRNLKEILKLIEPMQHKPDIICLTDTKNPTPKQNTNIRSYTFLHAKTDTNAGGVAIYVKSILKCIERKDLQFALTGCENLWIELTNVRTILIIGVIYRHQFRDKPSERLNEFKLLFRKTIEKISKEAKLFYILGDFNINLLLSEKQPREYKNFLYSLGCKLLITKPTRVPRLTRAHHRPSLIDHIYTNDPDTKHIRAGIIESDEISDHYPIFCISSHTIPWFEQFY